MKICIISNLYPPYVRGGAEIVVGRLAEALRDNLHHVFVISTQPYENIGSLWVTTTTVNEVQVYRFTPANIYYYLNDFRFPEPVRALWHLIDIFNFHSYFVVKKLLKKEKPDVVITHNLMGIGFLIPLLLRRQKIKHLHTLHDVQLYAPSGIIIKGKEKNWQQRLVNLLGYPKLMNWLMGSPKAVISPSRFLLDFYKSHNFFRQSQTIVHRNPADFETTIPLTTSPDFRLAYLGQISKAKGVLKVIELVKNFELPNLKLKVIGLGPDLHKALELAKNVEAINFYGWRSRQDILDILSQSDALIMPSTCYENSPTVILEALGFGLPVITSDIGGAGELVTEGYNGWKFEAGNWKQLEKLIYSLAKDKSQMKSMSANCRKSVEEFTYKNYVSQLLKMIEG